MASLLSSVGIIIVKEAADETVCMEEDRSYLQRVYMKSMAVSSYMDKALAFCSQ